MDWLVPVLVDAGFGVATVSCGMYARPSLSLYRSGEVEMKSDDTQAYGSCEAVRGVGAPVSW